MAVRYFGRRGGERSARFAAIVGGIGVVSLVSAEVRLEIWQAEGVLPGGFPLWYARDMLGLAVMRSTDGNGMIVFGGAMMVTILTALALAFAYGAAQRLPTVSDPQPVVHLDGVSAAA